MASAVAERFDYVTVLYFDAGIAVLAPAVTPLLKDREPEGGLADPADG